MKYFVQVNKEDKRVIAYGSNSSNSSDILEIEINSDEVQYNELLENPFIFIFNDVTNQFSKDTEYQARLIKENENRLTPNEKIEYLTKQLADEKLSGMKKDLTINMLIQQQAQNKIEIMKMKGSNQ